MALLNSSFLTLVPTFNKRATEFQVRRVGAKGVPTCAIAEKQPSFMQSPPSMAGRHSVRTQAKKAFGDQLMDYIEAGPKMRKWYGQGDGEDDYEIDFDDDDDEDPRPPVLVTDAESEMGQIVVLELILQRQRVRVLVNNLQKSKSGFGPYVEPFEGDTGNPESLVDALRGTKMIICCGKVGMLAEAAAESRSVAHLVLLSGTGASTGEPEQAVGGGGFLGGLFDGGKEERRLLRSSKREAKVLNSKVPYTVVRVGQFKDVAGNEKLTIDQGDALTGTISREGAAKACVQAALCEPPSTGLVFEVIGSGSAGMEQSQLKAGITTLIQE